MPLKVAQWVGMFWAHQLRDKDTEKKSGERSYSRRYSPHIFFDSSHLQIEKNLQTDEELKRSEMTIGSNSSRSLELSGQK